MLFWPLILVFCVPNIVHGSPGDGLPEYRRCVTDCESAVCLAKSPSPKFSQNSVNPISGFLFGWDCLLDCGYKCQQLVTASRVRDGEEVVQFNGKWPFVRVWGITELFSTLFSLGNFYVNYFNYRKLVRFMKLHSSDAQKLTILRQFMILCLVNLFGWACSAVFHIRDTPFTETMDYLGAGAIVMANFNAVCVRFFNLHHYKNQDLRKLFQYGLLFVLLIHYTRLYVSWDYQYNMAFNVVIGLLAAGFWISHSIAVFLKCSNGTLATDSTYIAPYEMKVLQKLRYVGITSAYVIPFIPVALNLFLILSVSLELLDFVPWFLLIDAHSLWHACTIFPPIIWYDWNIWELELSSFDSRLP